jgi:hypothetical protein
LVFAAPNAISSPAARVRDTAREYITGDSFYANALLLAFTHSAIVTASEAKQSPTLLWRLPLVPFPYEIKELNSVTGLVGASRRLALTWHPQGVALRHTPIILKFIGKGAGG